MLTSQKEESRIFELISKWVSDIRISNYSSYLDINKASEGLALRLLNLVYDYELVDLNHEKQNFPGIDLGDRTKAKIGIQVTSRADKPKIDEALKLFHKYDYHSVYSNGLKLFILSTDSINYKRGVKAPYNRFFSYQEGIITPSSLTRHIKLHANDSKRSQILSLLEQELGETSHLESILKKIMKNMTSTTLDANLRAIGHLLVERTSRRISKFIELEQESWQHGYRSGEEYINKFRALFRLDEDYKTKIIPVLTSAQEGTVARILFDEYLELEKLQFNMLAETFTKDQYQILMSTGRAFQFILHSLLDALIDKYNENLLILKTYFHIDVPKIENQYKIINESILYSDIDDKQDKLNKLLDNFSDPFGLYIFLDSKENMKFEYSATPMAKKIYGDLMGMEIINKYLTGVLETVSLDGKVFTGFRNRRHVIFLIPVDDSTKKALSILQQRSNFGIYYFEKV
ncbi:MULTISPECIES: SMEK domain-containing protein [Paenibacillus]|uniref:SMEK domain-containing protein n=1 Tax=Paenibacillus TaxID=44249 RepID=UPI002AB45C17|nr:SMEK domain-containing protein [Paenibacillus polymyxa]MDY8025256.1 SMEK domain-containing protein [Paenibacillus polymyxa]